SLAESGSDFIFDLTADGACDPAYVDHGAFEVEHYGVDYQGQESCTLSQTYSDMVRDLTRVELGLVNVQGSKTADLTTGAYTWVDMSVDQFVFVASNGT